MRSLPQSLFLGKKTETASVVLETRAQPESQMQMPLETGLLKNDGRKLPSVRQLFAGPPCRSPNAVPVCFRSVLRRWGFPLSSFLVMFYKAGYRLWLLPEWPCWICSEECILQEKKNGHKCSAPMLSLSFSLLEAQVQTQCKRQSN